MLEIGSEAAQPKRAARLPKWTGEAAWAVYQRPFNDLLFEAQSLHRQHFDPNRVQLSRLLNIKT
ncbi:MAG: biotin synthase BioB, partial [Bradyrhizobium sp.]